MTDRHPGETLEQFAIRTAWEYGHFWSDTNPDGWNIRQEDLPLLSVEDPVVVKAFISLSKMEVTRYTNSSLNSHGRMPDFDGVLGPAMTALFTDQSGRCPVPDFAPPPGVHFAFDDPDVQEIALRMQERQALAAVGTGNWKRCHGIGEYHCSLVRVNPSGLPAHVKPFFTDILKQCQFAYAQTGLLFLFTDMNGRDLLTGDDLSGLTVNIDFSFVDRSDGWIGLAILGQAETCTTRIWCRFLNTFHRNGTPQKIKTDWITLILHELGHNTGRNHTSGGIMNPTLLSGLSGLWEPNDPSTGWLRQRHGGVPAPIPGITDPVPPDDPKPPFPPTDVQKQLDALHFHNLKQDIAIKFLMQQVNP